MIGAAAAGAIGFQAAAPLSVEYLLVAGGGGGGGSDSGGMVTGGKFDHKTNPIDIVKKGQKIGEMTGGEVILNPAQQQKLSKESAYFRQRLKKFNKQK